MANYVGGDIGEAVCKHDELGTFRFQVVSDEDAPMKMGGVVTQDDEAITGGGVKIDKKKRMPWSVELTLAADFTSENETNGIHELSAHSLPGIWTISLASGDVYKGKGKPVGEFEFSTKDAQVSVKLMGSGKLSKL